jgi:hypothetical protein
MTGPEEIGTQAAQSEGNRNSRYLAGFPPPLKRLVAMTFGLCASDQTRSSTESE